MIIGAINKVPSTDKSIVHVLAKELKAVETENHLLRQEVDYLKKQLEHSDSANKILDRKLSIISDYFKEALSRLEEDEPGYKRYKVLLGVLGGATASSGPDWGSLGQGSQGVDQSSALLSSSNVSDSHRPATGHRMHARGDLHTVDTSNRSSSNLNISSDGRRKRDKLLKAAKKMRSKCDTFLKRFEEVEEAERLAKLKNIEESRKQTNLNKGSYLTPDNQMPNIQNLIANISQRTTKGDSILSNKPKDQPIPTQTQTKPAGPTPNTSRRIY